jgi:hypothetical protein
VIGQLTVLVGSAQSRDARGGERLLARGEDGVQRAVEVREARRKVARHVEVRRCVVHRREMLWVGHVTLIGHSGPADGMSAGAPSLSAEGDSPLNDATRTGSRAEGAGASLGRCLRWGA